MDRITLKKGEFLQETGEYNIKVYKVEEGLLRSYSIDEKGKEHIFLFAPEGWIMGDAVSEDEPSQLYIDAIEPSIVTVIDKQSSHLNDAQKLRKRLEVLQKRIIMLMSASAIERYHDFLQTYPEITQRISQKMLASYLGITPEALSSLKKEYLTKKR